MTEKNPTDTEPSLVWGAKWLHDRWPRIASAVGTGGLAGAGIWFSVKGKEAHWCAWLVFGFALAAWIVGEISGWKQEEKLSSLSEQLKGAEASRHGLEQLLGRVHGDYFALFQDHLSILANDVFELTDRERISVYKHDGKAFVMLGRYSKNPVYNKKGRAIYPDSEGCIAEAWKGGESAIHDLPDPNSDLDTYATAHKAGWGINKQVAKAFQMKSRSYVALAVEDRLQKRIAVVVFESTCSNGALDKGGIQDLLGSYEGKRIAQFLDTMRAFEPSPTYAHEEGY